MKARDTKEFRQQFQRSLKNCIQKGFAVEECFGVVWEETAEQFSLPDSLAGRVYEEMLTWAKGLLKASRPQLEVGSTKETA